MSGTTRDPIMAQLKDAIDEIHARFESLPFFEALQSGDLPLACYVGQLRALASIHATLEHELAHVPEAPIRTILLDQPARLNHLRQDLAFFDSQRHRDIEAVLMATRSINEEIRKMRVKHPAALLGVLYVLQGSMLGHRVLLPKVRASYGEQVADGLHYMSGYGEQTSHYWQAFKNTMNNFPLNEAGRQAVLDGARDFFGALESLYHALYPVEDAQWVYSAGMLNPEAGDHAVPEDAREIDAAIEAAMRCFEAYPYFEARYHERGRGFARSDAAWKVTLCSLPMPQVISQIEWLGRVLANRGMPRITLERQLTWLHEALVQVAPENSTRYKRLLDAAEHLKAERVRIVPEPQFLELATVFCRDTDNELQGTMRGTGELIVSAVCDEAAGILDAVNSLRPWLCDPERFPAPWIAAVGNAFDEAQAIANDTRPQTP